MTSLRRMGFVAGGKGKRGEGIGILNGLKAYLVRQNINDFVDEGMFPPPKLERQLSFLLESFRMKAQEAAIAGLRQ